MDSFNPVQSIAQWLITTFALESDVAVGTAVLAGIGVLFAVMFATAALITHAVERFQS